MNISTTSTNEMVWREYPVSLHLYIHVNKGCWKSTSHYVKSGLKSGRMLIPKPSRFLVSVNMTQTHNFLKFSLKLNSKIKLQAPGSNTVLHDAKLHILVYICTMCQFPHEISSIIPFPVLNNRVHRLNKWRKFNTGSSTIIFTNRTGDEQNSFTRPGNGHWEALLW